MTNQHAVSARRNRFAAYIRFTLPLLLVLPLTTVGRLVQNAALLGLSAGVRELAAFAIAAVLMNPFANSLGMAPQLVTVWANNPAGLAAVQRFILRIGCAAMALMVVLAATPLNTWVIGGLYRLDASMLQIVSTYLLLFSIILPLEAMLKISQGVFIRLHRSTLVTVIQLSQVLLVAAVLWVANAWDVPIRVAIAASIWFPPLLLVPISWYLQQRYYTANTARQKNDGTTNNEAPPSTATLIRMFVPMAGSTILFTISHPIIFAIIAIMYGSGATSETFIAALTLAFTTGFLFQGMINSMRHVMVTFGHEHLEDLRRFIIYLAAVVDAGMIIFVSTPAVDWFMMHVQGAHGDVMRMASEAMIPLVLAVPLLTWRNWYHGMGLVNKRTGVMLIGGIARNIAVAVFMLIAVWFGLVSHITASLAMVAAFATEAGVTAWFSRQATRRAETS